MSEAPTSTVQIGTAPGLHGELSFTAGHAFDVETYDADPARCRTALLAKASRLAQEVGYRLNEGTPTWTIDRRTYRPMVMVEVRMKGRKR